MLRIFLVGTLVYMLNWSVSTFLLACCPDGKGSYYFFTVFMCVMGSGDGSVIHVASFTNFRGVSVFLKCFWLAHKMKLCSLIRTKVIHILVNQHTRKLKEHLKPRN